MNIKIKKEDNIDKLVFFLQAFLASLRLSQINIIPIDCLKRMACDFVQSQLISKQEGSRLK